MDPRKVANDIALLREWALPILKQEVPYYAEDLFEIIRIRQQLEAAPPSAHLALRDLDALCEPYCGTLLELPEDFAPDVSGLNWHAVHQWPLVRDVLELWTHQVNAYGVSATPSDVLRALLAAREEKGREYFNTFFVGERGEWRTRLDPEEIEDLAQHFARD